ncbi:TonB-dependent siderophore receptor [Ciceribacter sp. L1K22]|uniref:TonB-dependent siderophore receptor n=1 Tax=Ciceribacter sp. L1K22 TaxID=2820275 RepID=UPI001FEDB07F|nr:TonB-dependent siderophore receptor [Ciceribacter sp. L1K22]
MGRESGVVRDSRARRERQGRQGGRLLTRLIASTVLTGALTLPAMPVFAQQAVSFSIPAQPLSSAIAAFIRASGWEVGYSSPIVAGKTSNAVTGAMPPAEALQTLLAGTGITVQVTGATKAALVDPTVTAAAPAADGSTVLETITVEGAGANAMIGPGTGIIATGSQSGSKTGTPLVDVPASVSVVTQAEMTTRGAAKLDEVLNYTAGVSTDIYGSDDRYDFYLMRGFYQGGTGNYRDGLPLRINSFTGSRMEPYAMQRVEVLKGSTSTLFGMNNPGGLVNSITKRPQDEKFGEVYTTFGKDHIETGTDFGGPIDDEGVWTYRLTGKWQDGSNGVDFSEDDRVFIAPALTWSPDDATSLTIMGDYNKRDSNTSHGVPFGSGIDSETYLGEPDFDSFDTVEKNIGYDFSHDFGNGLQVRQTARYTDLDLTYESVYGGTTNPADNRNALAVYGESQRFAIDNQLQYDASFDRFDSRTLFGIDYTWEDATESRADGTATGIDASDPVYCGRACVFLPAPTITDSTMKTTGIYAQEELTLDNRWILTLGGRYDFVEQTSESGGFTMESTDEAFTGRVGVTFKATDQLSVYASYSESFQPVAPIYATYLTNPEPQEGTQYEIGAKYQPEGFDAIFSVAYFDLTQTNVAQWTGPLPTQVGEVNVRGLELEGKAALTDQVNLTLAYSYWNAEITDDSTATNIGNRPQLVPEHIASAWFDYTIPGNGTFGDLTLGLGARYVGSTYADNANTIDLSSRTLVDAAISYKVTDSATLAINATNIFDKEYISHVDTFSNTAYYGDRRAVKATLRYTW